MWKWIVQAVPGLPLFGEIFLFVMKIALLGHSFVRDLESHALTTESEHNFRYFWKPGSCFNYWLSRPSQLEDCIAFKPDILYIVLGSNSIVDSIPLCETKQKAKSFYSLLRSDLPVSIIVQCEIENRYLSFYNYKGTPPHLDYHRLRRRLNQYICSDKTIDFFCNIGGPGRLDKEVFYKRDKIHLNSAGLECYWDCLGSHIDFVISKIKQ